MKNINVFDGVRLADMPHNVRALRVTTAWPADAASPAHAAAVSATAAHAAAERTRRTAAATAASVDRSIP